MIALISSTQRSLEALSSIFCLHRCISSSIRALILFQAENSSQILCLFQSARVPFSASGRVTHTPSTVMMHRRYSSLWDKICSSHPSSASRSMILKFEDEFNRSIWCRGKCPTGRSAFRVQLHVSSDAHCPISSSLSGSFANLRHVSTVGPKSARACNGPQLSQQTRPRIVERQSHGHQPLPGPL